MKLFKGVFNYQGESHTLYTHASTREVAFINFVHQLVKKLFYSYQYLYMYFTSGKDNHLITEVIPQQLAKIKVETVRVRGEKVPLTNFSGVLF